MSNLGNVANFLAYAFGFALGTAVGLVIEERLSIGMVIMRIITTDETERGDRGVFAGRTVRCTTCLDAKGARGKNGQNEWQIVEPRPLRADSGQVDVLLGKLRDAKMDLSMAPDEAAKKFATATTVALALVTDSSGAQAVEVRKDKDNNYYARSSAVPGVYKVSADVGEGLNKSLDDFRNKKLFDFDFSDPTKLDIRNGTAAPVTYSKTGEKWTAGARNLDNASVQNLIDKLRDLTAAKFAEQNGGQPVFDAGVTSNNGKRNERVIVNKQGDKYFAQREGEPSIYELDAKAVEDLERAAADVKDAAPAAPPAPKKKKIVTSFVH